MASEKHKNRLLPITAESPTGNRPPVINYADITVGDPNPIKRRLQRLRLRHALRGLPDVGASFLGKVLDYGAGNGELAKHLRRRFPHAEIVCYEPAPMLRKQAEENLRGLSGISILDNLADVAPASFGFIFCLEVFEHLPDPQTEHAFQEFRRLTAPDAHIIIGVPNEIFLAGLIKGAFRISRRYGEYDATVSNVLRAALGKPPRNRPVVSLQGLPYITRHMGFDHRRFCRQLAAHFRILHRYGSPFPALPLWLNFELYFICQTAANSPDIR